MLPRSVLEVFEDIRKGQPFPLAWMATVDVDGAPRTRTVRIMAFNLQQGKLYFSSNREHAKHRHLARDPRVEVCMLNLESLNQLRVQGKGVSEATHPLRASFWNKLSPQSRVDLYCVHPQRETAPDNFIVTEILVGDMEILRLRASPPERWRLHRNGDGYSEERVPV